MKTKIFSILTMLLVSATLGANGVRIDNMYYILEGDSATVTYPGTSYNDYNKYAYNITIPQSVSYNNQTYRVTSIGDHAFYNCTQVYSVATYEGIKRIEDQAFYGCTRLKSIVIPHSVDSIGTDAFYGVENVVYIGTATGTPWGAKYVNKYNDGTLIFTDSTKAKLYGCTPSAIEKISIPYGVKYIDRYAFKNCTKLTTLSIPSSVNTILEKAFYNCSSLKSIICWPGSPLYLLYQNIETIEIIDSIFVPYSSLYTLDTYSGEYTWINDLIFPIYFNNITISTNNAVYGRVSPIQFTQRQVSEYQCDTVCTFEAWRNKKGYLFETWSDGNRDNPRSVTYTSKDTNFTAIFVRDTFTITTQSDLPELGRTIGDTTVLYLDTAIIEAIPNYGYEFAFWRCNKDADWYGLSNPDTIQVTRSATYTACFGKRTFAITKLNENDHGWISGSDSSLYLNTVTLTATPNYGYHFTQWSDGSIENPRSFVLTQDTTFEALFDRDTFTISTKSNYSERGITYGDTSVLYLDTATITAIPNYGYYFDKWSYGDKYRVCYDNPQIVRVYENRIYTAIFEQQTFNISTLADANKGNVTGPNQAKYLDTVTLIAKPNFGYHFTHWSDSIMDNPRSFILTKDTTLGAILLWIIQVNVVTTCIGNMVTAC